MDNTLSNLMPLADYQAQRQHIFPSKASVEWFTRQNRAELIEAGALLKLGHRTPMADASKFDAVVLEVGRRKAAGAR